jgi:xanthine dehydrogenase large subunit
MKTPKMGFDTYLHVRGDSVYIDDHPVPEGVLYAAAVTSNAAAGRILECNTDRAMEKEGVVRVFTAADIPGENQIGNIIQDEPLFAEDEVEFWGQPIALVVGRTEKAARLGAAAVDVTVEKSAPIIDPREAYRSGRIIGRTRVFSSGDVDSAWEKCDVIVSGRADSGGQEHLYLETQGALSIPDENGALKIISATQNPTHVQKITARILGVDMHRIEVEVVRLGGAFGGKEDQATAWASMTALAATALRKPVKLVLPRHDDLRSTGKRHPYSSDYCLGLSEDGTFLAYEATYYQNAGSAADLSPAVLERTLFHANGSYFIPNVKATGVCCRTNLPPNTAFRGFGGPQAMFVLEAAIFKAARVLGVEPSRLQEKNLLQEGDRFHYGMTARMCQARRCFESAKTEYKTEDWKQRIDEFNISHRFEKKGLAFMPVCFGISFTNVTLNQAQSLVHIYMDGSVGVTTGAVEMGQGVKQKIVQVAARILSLDEGWIKIERTSTTRSVNTSPTAASTGSDINGKATELACLELKRRLAEFAAKQLGCPGPESIRFENGTVQCRDKEKTISWRDFIEQAYIERINLSAHAHFATPNIYFDKETETGEPFAYHAYGTAVLEATVDCIRGTYRFDAVKVIHDAGLSLNEMIDLGQSEGAIAQGLGWLTMEEVVFNKEGRLLADMLSNYKIPDIYSTPAETDIRFLKDSPNPMGVFNSKAIGEPPFMYGIGGYFALAKAVQAFRLQQYPDAPWPDEGETFTAPFTPERVLLSLYKQTGGRLDAKGEGK